MRASTAATGYRKSAATTPELAELPVWFCVTCYIFVVIFAGFVGSTLIWLALK